jgi:fumarylacetoacetase
VNVEIPDGSPFPLTNLPYCVFSRPGEPARVGAAVGDHLVDLAPSLDETLFWQPSLNPLLAAGPARWVALRSRLVDLLTGETRGVGRRPYLISRAEVSLHRPVDVGDYVDFYSFIDHAANLGRILRPGTEPLSPNWRHLPIGYHGRAGTIVVSGTPIIRPMGQRVLEEGAAPQYGPSTRLDIEAEVGFVVGPASEPGQPVAASQFAAHIFGVVLINDWSARDIQAWEYVPLGPFLGKSFATSMSPWVVPLDALTGARVAPPPQDPPPLPHLVDNDPWSLDLALEVSLNDQVVSRPPFSAMYWTPGQQLAHLTSNGATVRPGDLLASGTVSGPEPDQWGSLIELTDNGRQPLHLAGGDERGFLEDGDTVVIAATAPGIDGNRIGLGEVRGTIEPALL